MSRKDVRSSLCLFLLAALLPASLGVNAYAQTTRARCPYDNNRIYEVVTKPGGITWAEADSESRRRGGYLAPIKTLNQFNWMQQAFGLALREKWMGAFRERSCFEFARWLNVDGSNSDFLNTAIPWDNRNNSGCSEDRAQWWTNTPLPLLNDRSRNAKVPGYVMVYPR